MVVAHLGNGASMCALRDGRSIESTMGFTALDGLPMGTRTGALDPGVLLYLMQAQGMDGRAASRRCCTRNRACSASPASPTTCATLLASTEPGARQRVELFCYSHRQAARARWRRRWAASTRWCSPPASASTPPPIREEVCRRAEWLGIHLDAAANARADPRITTAASPTSAWVIPTDEEKMIAIHTRDLLAARLSRIGRRQAAEEEIHVA